MAEQEEPRDLSKYIFDRFYPAGKPLRITLKNGQVLEGELSGFYHGDPDSNDPFITRWHFMGKGEENLPPIGNGDPGCFLEQEDIARVEFAAVG